MTGLIIGLLISGFILLGVEIFVPGGIVGVFGGLLLLAGVGLSFYEYGVAHGLWIFCATTVVGFALLYGGLRILPQTRLGRAILLNQTVEGETYDAAATEERGRLLGREGVAHTVLRPSGKGEIDGRRWDVVTDGAYIARGQPFRVVGVEGGRIVVSGLEEEPRAKGNV